jgi:hypothetical protein
MKARLIIGSLLLAASTTLFAQAPAQPGQPKDGQRGMRPCAQESDPAKCEAQRKEMRAHYMAAREACKGKEGGERGACIAQQMCAKAPEPAKCMSNAKERMEQRRKMRGDAAPKT